MSENTKSRPDLASLKAAAEKATHPKEWRVVGRERWRTVIMAGEIHEVGTTRVREDAEFIVALRNAFPALCETLERLTNLNEDLTSDYNALLARSAKLERYEAALKFYATVGSWVPNHHSGYSLTEVERGDRARRALANE